MTTHATNRPRATPLVSMIISTMYTKAMTKRYASDSCLALFHFILSDDLLRCDHVWRCFIASETQQAGILIFS